MNLLLARKEVIKKEYPWINKQGQNLFINDGYKKVIVDENDFDGVLSFFIYTQTVRPAKIVGFYSLKGKSAVLSSKYSIDFSIPESYKNILGLDMDINFIPCIGHHFIDDNYLEYRNNLSKNLNVMFNVKKITEKCPYNTVLSMCYYYEGTKNFVKKIIENKDFKKMAAILYADNFLNIYNSEIYQQNCIEWFKKTKMSYIKDFIDLYNQEIFNECVKIEKSIISNKYIERTKNAKMLSFFQRVFNYDKTLKIIYKLFDTEYTKQNLIFSNSIVLERERTEKIENNNFFSMAMVLKNKVNITTFTKKFGGLQ